MVAWPGVLIWQLALTIAMLGLIGQLWRQKQWPMLGHGLDLVMGLGVAALGLSSLFAQFQPQAIGYGWAGLVAISTLYTLHSWLTPERHRQLLITQGLIAYAFIVVSLLLWLSQSYLPTLTQLTHLQDAGLAVPLNLQQSQLRNWHPLGHPNYVAGYLVLNLPLLLGLGLDSSKTWRWIWGLGLALGSLTLYTTSSRGGLLALGVWAMITGLLMTGRSVPAQRYRWLIWSSIGSLGLLSLWMAPRLRNAVIALVTGQSGGAELAYRLITQATGWHMGLAHPWTGSGLGGVPLLFQAYRPGWAGREAELVFQLHSTPAQLWAEMGLPGILFFLAGLLWLGYWSLRWERHGRSQTQTSNPALIGSLFGGLLSYWGYSLTDYQLDNISITGTVIIFLAVLAPTLSTHFPPTPPSLHPLKLRQLAAGLCFGIFLANFLGLIPVYRAWRLSHVGFIALQDNDLRIFEQTLTQAQTLAPWDPYYPYQLGWNLGEVALQTDNPEQKAELTQAAIQAFNRGLQLSPYQEFGYSNLGWLLMSIQQAQQALVPFAQSAHLIPAKVGVFWSLGYALSKTGHSAEAVQAFSLEILRHPLQATSPLWQSPDLQAFWPQIQQQVETDLTELIEATSDSPELNLYLHQLRGGLRWWWGHESDAQQDFDRANSVLGKLLLTVNTASQPDRTQIQALPQGPARLTLEAWLTAQPHADRDTLLTQAWLLAADDSGPHPGVLPPDPILKALSESMAQSHTLDQWLKEKAPTQPLRNERLGFGTLSRHMDGPNPIDYLPRLENIPMTRFLGELFPSPKYFPKFDQALQPNRDQLLNRISVLTRLTN
jgi:tetratricopeptide (TPR) repeat protein